MRKEWHGATARGRWTEGRKAARAAEALIADRMGSPKLGQRDHDAFSGSDDWRAFRRKVGDAIEALRSLTD